MEPYQFPSHYPHQSRLADHDLFAHDQYPKVGVSNYPHSSLAVGAQQSHAQTSEGVINPPRHSRSDQVYASPMSMDTMPMLLYPGTSSTPHCSNLSQYPYDNLRIPQTLDNNYIPISSHYEVFPSDSSRTVNFGVRTVFIYPFDPFLTHRDTDTGGSSYCENTTVQRTLGFAPRDADPFSGSRVAPESINIGSAFQYIPTVWVDATRATPTIPSPPLQD